MDYKKNPKADLEKRRGLLLEIGLIVSLGVIVALFEWGTRPQEDAGLQMKEEAEAEQEQVRITQPEPPEPPKPPEPSVTEELVMVENDAEVDSDVEIDASASEDQEVNFDDLAMDKEESKEDKVFMIVEDMPSFKGGGKAKFRKYIQQNVNYPSIARDNGIEGKVYVQFVVDENGNITQVKVVRGVHPALNKAAKNVVKNAPKWEPGKQRGKPVSVKFTFPINFVLSD